MLRWRSLALAAFVAIGIQLLGTPLQAEPSVLQPTDAISLQQRGRAAEAVEPTDEQARGVATAGAVGRQHELALRDVAAQEAMAIAARATFWATIGQIALGLLGFIALVLTVRHSSEALTVARNGLISALEERRPWIQPEIACVEAIRMADGLVKAQLKVTLRNRGKAPARSTRFAIVGVRKRHGAPTNLDAPWKLVHSVIAQQTEQNEGRVIFPENPCELSPLLGFTAFETIEDHERFDLVVLTLATYEWSLAGGGNARGSTLVTGSVVRSGADTGFLTTAVTKGCKGEFYHFMGDDQYL